jgi:hypothetical protein
LLPSNNLKASTLLGSITTSCWVCALHASSAHCEIIRLFSNRPAAVTAVIQVTTVNNQQPKMKNFNNDDDRREREVPALASACLFRNGANEV